MSGEPLHQHRAAVWLTVTPLRTFALLFSLTISIKVKRQTSLIYQFWWLFFFFVPLLSPNIELNRTWQCFLYVHHNFATNSPHAMLEICLTNVFSLKGKYQKEWYHFEIDFFFSAKQFALISNTFFLQMLSAWENQGNAGVGCSHFS